MREIVLDTETTGLNPYDNPRHRIVEIGAVEVFNQVPTGKTYHQYIQPERNMPTEAFEVHGIGEDFLADKPVFAAIAEDFLAFVGDAKLVIHNAEFDMRFLNAELEWAGKCTLPLEQALDTLKIARRKFPGSPASLDALCRRFGIDNSAREKHGALLDSEILAEVYLELTGGKQPDFALSQNKSSVTQQQDDNWRPRPRPNPLPSRLTDMEKAAHAAFVDALGDETVWSKLR
ncbi:DNA polymerase III subunit epsilon [Rhodobacteraceae bacterium N5(2021)]|uniref:DNA polymerase III subunit epsilon n=1 Tax=Gymnodinialimonas phycosphaerae TaxID=2841589 RepID=A0A975TSQ3_9RHOB|nr:DNA polymerase III subunit epsilon [Gymnodinialimonas phycosphaerae]MBY4894265.1 DNA polymerase III subunit epsilon [Gymnodinialimonas phycosphaerae]